MCNLNHKVFVFYDFTETEGHLSFGVKVLGRHKFCLYFIHPHELLYDPKYNKLRCIDFKIIYIQFTRYVFTALEM